MQERISAINDALKEMKPRLVAICTEHGEKAVLVVSEPELVKKAAEKLGANEADIRRALNIMVTLHVRKRYADKGGNVYIDAGIGEQG